MASRPLWILINIAGRHILWWYSTQWKMGLECSSLWYWVRYQWDHIFAAGNTHSWIQYCICLDWHDQPKQPNQRRSCNQNLEVLFISKVQTFYDYDVFLGIFRRINHPSYENNQGVPNYDLQLIELATMVNFTDPSLSHVFPACWPSSEPTSGRVMVLGCYSFTTS